jgi:hypothetical protein
MPQVPPRGVWCPAVTFFTAQDTLDIDAQATYFTYLSKTGLAGLVVLGTNAETFLLTREERKALVATARQAVGPSFPLMAGVGGHSTVQVRSGRQRFVRVLGELTRSGVRAYWRRYGSGSRFSSGPSIRILRTSDDAPGSGGFLRADR